MSETSFERELDGLSELLELRSGRDDLSFVRQVLDGVSRLILRRFLEGGADTPEQEKRAYRYLLDLLEARIGGARSLAFQHAFRVALKEVGVRVEEVRSLVTEIIVGIEAEDLSPSVIRQVEASLKNLFKIAKKLIARESDLSIADARVALSWGQEDARTEFKASLRVDLNKGEVAKQLEFSVLKTLAGLMNFQGGRLYVGVDDDGRPVGIEYDLASLPGGNKRDAFLRHFANIVIEHLGRENYQFLETDFVDIEGVTVFVVHVEPSSRPVFVRRGREEIFFVRAGASTVSLNAREAISYYVGRWPANPLRPAVEG